MIPRFEGPPRAPTNKLGHVRTSTATSRVPIKSCGPRAGPPIVRPILPTRSVTLTVAATRQRRAAFGDPQPLRTKREDRPIRNGLRWPWEGSEDILQPAGSARGSRSGNLGRALRPAVVLLHLPF